MSDRLKDITKFTYVCYRRFKRQLGEFDATVACTELSIRELDHQYGKAKDQQLFIESLSNKHQINVDLFDYSKLALRANKYYILSVHQQLEVFLENFKLEFKEICNLNWAARSDGESLMDNSIRNVESHCGEERFSRRMIDIYDYYRLIRNQIAHGDKNNEQIHQQYKKVEEDKQQILDQFNLDSGINELDELCFDDFLLFTNVAKNLAFGLSYNAFPSIKLIAKKIIENPINKRTLTKVKNNEDRFRNALKSIHSTKYGRISENDFKDLHLYVIGLLA